MKSLPLYLGGLLIALAVAGAAMTLLTPPPPPPVVQAPPPSRRALVGRAPAPAPKKDEISPEQVRAQDEEDIIKILLAQIESTPTEIDAAWIAEMCREIDDVDSLDVFWKEVVAGGQSFGIAYASRNRKTGMVMSRNSFYYVFEAREHIYSTAPKQDNLLGDGRGLLDMAVAKSWEASRKEIREQMAKEQRKKADDIELPEEVGTLDDELKTTYFKEFLKLYAVLGELVVESGGDARKYVSARIRLHEAAIVDRHQRLTETMAQARDRYPGTTQSSAPAMVQIKRWSNSVNEHLLALGKIYIEAALAEKAYRGRMQDYADFGFKALAMVYQRSHSGEALGTLREVNRIQRYNLWQMARVAWKKAKALAMAGRVDEADDEFLTAKHHYLLTLSRLERSKKKTVFGEYRRLQADITSWVTTRKLESVAATTDG
ncbi:MAG: hypothetical protein VCF24_29280 [Candidatus Latescibacterota bacterium]